MEPLKWTDWDDFNGRQPYIDFWERIERDAFIARDQFTDDPDSLVMQPLAQTLSIDKKLQNMIDRAFDRELLSFDSAGVKFNSIKDDVLSSEIETALQEHFGSVPVPLFARNGGYDPFDFESQRFPEESDLPSIDRDTVIVGVIDSGIALGHNRFRDSEGKTRILAAWQQTAEWARKEQNYLPFGQEFYEQDIDTLLAEHSGGSLEGWLDEDSFNTATGVLEKRYSLGHHEIAGRYAHGTHVLDAAAGIDPQNGDPEEMKRLKIIAVNFPHRLVFGLSGTFLDFYMLQGVQRIQRLVDAIWFKNEGEDGLHENGKRGYPVVINISFGRQAGSKDGHDFFPAELTKFNKQREESGWNPIQIVMPSGNDNLLRGNAYMELKPGEQDELNWRIHPDDQSSNYVEIWSEHFCNFSNSDERHKENPLAIAILPPGSDKTSEKFHPAAAHESQARYLGNAAALYGEVSMNKIDPDTYRFRYIVCVAPTLRPSGEEAVAPAGEWKIVLRNDGDKPVRLFLAVQTDQSVLPGTATGLRSFFDEANYEEFDSDTGEVIDSYSYPAKGELQNLDIRRPCKVRRHGTMNASAAHSAVARIGGYRLSDGKPAPYSSTGRGRSNGRDAGAFDFRNECLDRKREEESDRMVVGNLNKKAPTASFPTDDGASHFGVLAAGASNGSVVAMRGTSFASAQATRVAALSWFDDQDPERSAKARIYELAASANKADDTARKAKSSAHFVNRIDIEKSGGGRLPNPRRSKVKRRVAE